MVLFYIKGLWYHFTSWGWWWYYFTSRDYGTISHIVIVVLFHTPGFMVALHIVESMVAFYIQGFMIYFTIWDFLAFHTLGFMPFLTLD
jgi:hypothetical protein